MSKTQCLFVPTSLLCNLVFHGPVMRTTFGGRRQPDLGVIITFGWNGALSACGLPVEDSEVDGVDLALEALESPESFSSRF